MAKLFNLSWVFVLLAILAVGGGTAVLPEMQHMTVDHFHWVTNAQFRDIYSLGQVAPGPNMTMVLLIGYRMAGALGALVVGLAFFLPDCILTLVANRLWERFEGSPWRAAVQHGMAPVAIGLMASGTYAIARLSIFNVTSMLIALAVFGLLLWRHINPALLVAASGMAYAFLPHLLPHLLHIPR
jgi:chromate transporter